MDEGYGIAEAGILRLPTPATWAPYIMVQKGALGQISSKYLGVSCQLSLPKVSDITDVATLGLSVQQCTSAAGCAEP
jgi:hypothetical protein